MYHSHQGLCSDSTDSRLDCDAAAAARINTETRNCGCGDKEGLLLAPSSGGRQPDPVHFTQLDNRGSGCRALFKEWKLKPAGFLKLKVKTLNQGQEDRSE